MIANREIKMNSVLEKFSCFNWQENVLGYKSLQFLPTAQFTDRRKHATAPLCVVTVVVLLLFIAHLVGQIVSVRSTG